MSEGTGKPTVSVIIPVYKTAPSAFEGCLRSLARQELPDGALQAVVVYDGEPDFALRDLAGTAGEEVELIERIAPHSGVSAARNAGLAAARGRWIAFLDSDDELVDGALAKMVAFAEEEGCDMVFADHVKLYADGRREPCRYAEGSMRPSSTLQRRLRHDVLRPQTARGAVWGKLYSSELAADIRFCESLSVAEDTLFAAWAAHESERAGYLCEDVYLYRRNRASATVAWREDYVERTVRPIGAARELAASWADGASYAEDIDELALFHLMLVLVHYICNPDAPWSGARRKAEYRHVLSIPEFKEPLARANLSSFPFTRRVVLWSMRHGMWPFSRAIGAVRQKQLRSGGKERR